MGAALAEWRGSLGWWLVWVCLGFALVALSGRALASTETVWVYTCPDGNAGEQTDAEGLEYPVCVDSLRGGWRTIEVEVEDEDRSPPVPYCCDPPKSERGRAKPRHE